MAKISLLPDANPAGGEQLLVVLQEGETRKSSAADHIAQITLGAELARDQAADLILPNNIFVDVTLPTAEGAVPNGTNFKLVNSGTGLVDVRRRTPGGSILLYREATTALLALNGALGLTGGGTVQDLADDLNDIRTRYVVDAGNNRVFLGDGVGANHITTGDRTQGGAFLNGFGTVGFGSDQFMGADNDATASTATGCYNFTITGAKIYCCDADGFRALELLEDGMYVGAGNVDAFKDLQFGRNSLANGAKAGLYVISSDIVTLNGVSTGAGGGALASLVVSGTSACDYSGGNDRLTLSDAAITGVYACRNARGALFASHHGNNAVQNTAYSGGNNTGNGHGHAGALTTGGLNLFDGYGSGAGVITAVFTGSVGALSDAGNNNNAFAIGPQVVCTGPNEIVIGGTGHTVKVSNAIVVTCDARDKVDIQDLEFDGEFFDAIPVRQFRANFRDEYADVHYEETVVEEDYKAEVLVATGLVDSAGRNIMRRKEVDAKRSVGKTNIQRKPYDEEAHARGDKAGKRIRVSAVAQELDDLRKRFNRDYPGLVWTAHNNDQVEDEYRIDPETKEPVLGDDGELIPLDDKEHSMRGEDRWSLDPNPTFWMNVAATQRARADIRHIREENAALKAMVERMAERLDRLEGAA